MSTITVNASRSYQVVIGEGILHQVGKLVKAIKPLCKAAIVTDDKVANLYLEPVRASLEEQGYAVSVYVFPNGETSKSVTTYIDIVEFLSRSGLHREDLVVALGGGVVGDMAGFAAGTYMRGIDCVQIPTTLLAAVDSSVGGKTGVNLESGKNLLGVFHQPIGVLFDKNTLSTLDQTEMLAGLGECVKYAVLEGGELWDIMNDGITNENIARLVTLSVASKKRIVEADEREGGIRKLLNLGHTFGHAIETLSAYRVPHGIAVVKGIALMAKACVKRDILCASDYRLIIHLVEQYGFDYSCPYTAEELAKAVVSDKKADKEDIDMVVIRKIGDCARKKVPINKIEEFLTC